MAKEEGGTCTHMRIPDEYYMVKLLQLYNEVVSYSQLNF